MCARTDRSSTVAAIVLWIHTALMRQGNPGFAKEENGRGSVAPLSRTRQGKPGFAECSRERCASETADMIRVGPSKIQLDMLSSKC